jgi:cytochrome c2
MRIQFKIAATVLLCFLFVHACTNDAANTNETTSTTPSAEDKVKEGQRLVATLDCEICHSPKRMGPKGPEVIPELRFGGH